MAQANATIGLGYAAYYPTLNLTASAGLAAGTLGTLFSAPAFVWSVGASVSETVFDGGLRSATIAQYRAQYRATVAAYRQTVLTAFQQVEDDLTQLGTLTQQLERQAQVVGLAQRAFDLEKTRYETGIDPYLNLMTQQTLLLGEQQTLVNIHVQAMTASVALIEALGGGWQRSDLPAP
jgi:outer membrane protein TolC